MTINEAIDCLIKIRDKYGLKVEIYFDCPKCNSSFSPSFIQTETIHFSAKIKEIVNEPSR